MSIADDETDVEEDEREEEETKTDVRLELSEGDEEAELSSIEDV